MIHLVMLKFDPHSSKARELVESLMRHFEPSNLPDDICVVVGGDGYLLSVIAELGDEYTYLGLNSGSLGFMLNDVGNLEESAALLKEGKWSAHRVPRLSMTATTPQGESLSGLALNDVYLERMTGQTTHLRVRINGVRVVDRMVCDGLILSTALGSTAYSFSAGGTACHPELRLMQLTAICPHAPRLPPITLPLNAQVDIEVLDCEKRPARVVTDGADHPGVNRVLVANSGADVSLAFLENHDPTATLIRKVILT
jgi:NAD+ kinase